MTEANNKEDKKKTKLLSFDNFFVIAVNIFILIFAVIFIEGIFWVLNAQKIKNNAPVKVEKDNFLKYDELHGHVFYPDMTARERKSKNGEVFFDVEYKFDSLGRRITPLSESGERDKFALFFGCSYTAGEGVAENETLPYQFGRLNTEYKPYNYGVFGHSPVNLWLLLQNRNLKEEVGENSGIGIFFLIDDHPARVIGAMPQYNTWMANFPYVYEKDDTLVHGGGFRRGRIFTSLLYDIAGYSETFRYFNINFPLKRREKHFQLTAKLLVESQKLFYEQFPDSKFYVVYLLGVESYSRIVEILENNDVDCINVSDVYDRMGRKKIAHSFPDGHPKPAVYLEIAEMLTENILEHD